MDSDVGHNTNHVTSEVDTLLLSIARCGRIDRPWSEVRNIIETRIIEVTY